MDSRLFKILVLLALSSAVAGCKIAVMVPNGGEVTGPLPCAPGKVCEFKVTTDFSNSFTAVAKPGYQFVRWQKGTDFLCGDSTVPTCTVALTGNPVLDAAVIALFNMQYVVPIFEDIGLDPDGDGIRNELDEDDDNDGILDVDDTCPLNANPQCTLDSIVVNGKEWAQPDLFRGVSVNEIMAVCPEGICNGTLTGAGMSWDEDSHTWITGPSWAFDLNGWTWASDSDIATYLLTYYRGEGPDFGCSELDQFFADGWRVTGTSETSYGVFEKGDHVSGYVSSGDIGVVATFIRVGERCMAHPGQNPGYPTMQPAGAFFYRNP